MRGKVECGTSALPRPNNVLRGQAKWTLTGVKSCTAPRPSMVMLAEGSKMRRSPRHICSCPTTSVYQLFQNTHTSQSCYTPCTMHRTKMLQSQSNFALTSLLQGKRWRHAKSRYKNPPSMTVVWLGGDLKDGGCNRSIWYTSGRNGISW